ncbi:hypothetical protein [Massilia pseudoviolaceinigra]|uniref:hypothetical protein n=1 Tax=Massilia pseudoviolaceinigra TaxID=3057165 RepID=UPI002796C946|nr:hypothetical protein [Massilia sp. CCM 9206]MDQ1921290.1 hypothetical protein [Massilia sp. CCM 9206]
MSKLHEEIMTLPCKSRTADLVGKSDTELRAYQIGHRDARHAAAELVAAAEDVPAQPGTELTGYAEPAATYLQMFASEYEWRTDDFCHTPTPQERTMLHDFAVMLFEALGVDYPAAPVSAAPPRAQPENGGEGC